MTRMIGKFEHPVHGIYYLFYDGVCYGMSKSEYNGDSGIWCAYANLSSLLKAKGF